MCNTAALPLKKGGCPLDLFFIAFGLCPNVIKNKSSGQKNLFTAEGGYLAVKKTYRSIVKNGQVHEKRLKAFSHSLFSCKNEGK